MDLIYYGPLFRSRTRKVLYGQILKGDWVPLTNKMSGKIDKRPYRNFSQAIMNFIEKASVFGSLIMTIQ